jgi:hypothetical protein
MTNAENSPNAFVGRLCQTPRRFTETPYNDSDRHSDFVIPSSLDIRHSSLRIISFVSAKARYYLFR